MKLNRVSVPIIFVLVVFVIAIWKLNESYRQDLILQKNRIIEQQSSSLISAVSGYLSQLKNVLSSYENGIIESQINWMQIKPFFILARAEIKDKKINVTDLFAHSDSLGRSWNATFLTQALSFFKFSDQSISTKLFKNKSNQKFIALVFSDKDSDRALVVVGEADVFQKFFNMGSGQNIIYSLLTSDQIVAAHSQPSYVATISQERSNKTEGGLFLSDVIRGTDLTLVSYALNKAEQKFLIIPFSTLGIILGACLVLVGLLAYAYTPIENMLKEQKNRQREQEYSKVLQESKDSLGVAPKKDDENSLSVTDEIVPSEVAPEPQPERPQMTQIKSNTLTQTKTTMLTHTDTQSKGPAVSVEKTSVTQTGITLPPDGASIGSFGFYEASFLIEIAIKKMNSIFRETKISVVKNIASSAKIEVDPDRFVKAICNVLLNAVDAVKVRDRKEIEISFTEKDKQMSLTIKDSGSGIKEEDKERIWQPFFTTKNKKQHKGLGLSEAVSIARRYGFDLTVKNHQQGGAIAEFITQEERPIEESLPSMPVKSESNESSSLVEMTDSEIENILSLEDIDVKELQPTHFKLENKLDNSVEEKLAPKIEITEEPEINIKFREKKIDLSTVQIRKPIKDKAGSD